MAYTDKLTFVIFTYNEAARIERVLLNLRGTARVLIVDNHSEDDTRERATALGADILLHRNKGWVEDEVTTAIVKNHVQTPWLYWGYADEFLEPETLDLIASVIEADQHDIIGLARDNYYYGAYTHQAYAGGWLPRVFKKQAIDFTGNIIHRFGTITVPKEHIYMADRKKYFVHHMISNTAATFFRSYDHYTNVEAADAVKPLPPLKLLLRSLKTFAAAYILRGGYKAGAAGLYFCLEMLYFDWLLEMKRYERHHGLDFHGIEDRNNRARNRILHRMGIEPPSIGSLHQSGDIRNADISSINPVAEERVGR